jgi:transcriptional regulator with XRE-family HTH domain
MILLREHVRAARDLLHISRSDLAELAGLSGRTVIRFESGEGTISDENLWRIQTALEQCGIEFFNGGSPGVRYHPERDRRRQSRPSVQGDSRD